MSLTQQDTKILAEAVVKALDPKFKKIDWQLEQVDKRFGQIDQRLEQVDKRFGQIDQRFEQVDKRFGQIDQRFEQVDRRFVQIDQRFDKVDLHFKDLRLEIGDMIAPLATQTELNSLKDGVAGLNGRFDEFEDGFNQFAGNMAVFQSRVTLRFDHVDEKLEDHVNLIKKVYEQVGSHSQELRNHGRRLARLEKTPQA
jgi:archaellum component FlaC